MTSSHGHAAEADAAERQHLARLARVAAATSNLVIVTDAQRRIEWVNDAFTRTTGYTLDEVRGRSPGQLLQFEDTDRATVAGIRAALDARQPVHAEILNRGKSGQPYWLSIDIQPVLDAQGGLDGFIAIQTDISEKKLQARRLAQLAAEAEQARATLLAAVTALPDGFALFDAQERLVLCNARYEALHPRSSGALVRGSTLASILREELARGEYPEARGRERHWLEERLRSIREGSGWETETELADGRWVRSVKLRIADGQLIALRSDITQLKRAEKTAVAQRLAAMDASHDAIAIAAPDGRLSYVNAALARMFGGDGDHAWLGRDWSQLCHPADRAAIAAAAREAIAARGAWRGFMRARCGDGGAAHQEVSLTRAPDGSLVLIARDVSQLKADLQSEMALHDLLMTIASRYLNTPVEQVDAAIEAALGQLARFVDADRAYIFDYDWTAGTTSNTHEWCGDGIAPQRGRLQSVPLDGLCEWTDPHREGRSVNVPDVASRPPGDSLRQLLEPQGIRSCIAIPIMDGTRCEGFLGFDSVRRRHVYSHREQLLLSFFSEISRSLRNRARLETLSRDVSERLRHEEERRRLQDMVIRERVEHDARLERTMIEMKRLHDRDRQMREASEMVVRALRSLSEAEDPADGPMQLLRQMADAMGTRYAALLPLDADEDPFCTDHEAWWRALRLQGGLIDYLAERPRRLIADLSASTIFAPLAADTGLRWMATARVEPAQERHLLVVGGTDALGLDPGRSQLFQRFVPLLAEAVRRRGDSIRARKLEQDLQQAQKLEALGMLAGSIAHEINTPMQYIGDNLHFLKEAFGDLLPALAGDRGPAAVDAADAAYLLEEIPDALDQSLTGCRRIAEIVDAVRTFAYPDLAQDEDVDLRSVLEHCMIITRSTWKHEIDVVLDCAPDVPAVRGGPGQISQVFVNLITNACQAVRGGIAGGGRGVVHIELRSDGGFAVVHVDDNGPGVPPDLRQRIFDYFFTTKEVGKGTGQGLGISRGIVERYGGRLALSDSPLGGARFSVMLPIPSRQDA